MKKVVSFVLALVVFTTSIHAMFVPNIKQSQRGRIRVVCLSDGIDKSVIEKIRSSINGGGCYSKSSGEYFPANCTVTVKRIAPAIAENRAASTARQEAEYDVTVKMDTDDIKVKSDTNDYNYKKVRCTMYIRMKWIDRPGWRNGIKWLSGSATVYKGTIKSGKVSWGIDNQRHNNTLQLTNPKSFSFDPHYDYIDYEDEYIVGGGLYAKYEVTFKEDSDHIFSVDVCPTIFD